MNKIIYLMAAVILFLAEAGAYASMNIKVGNEAEISFGGYMENLSALRLGQEGKGKCAGFRSTFNPEFLFTFSPDASLFVSGRFVREMGYELEDNLRAGMGLDPLDDDYYNQTDFESYELFLDVNLSDRLSIRAGKQFTIWGETDVFTLLDVVNPSDSSWVPPGVMALEETRIPLYTARVFYEITPDTSLEFVFIPLIDDEENRVNKVGPAGGRWTPPPEDRLPVADLYPAMKLDIAALFNMYGPGPVESDVRVMKPESDLDQSRVGVRLVSTIGRTTFTFADFYGHNYSPVVHYEGTVREVRHELQEDPVTGNASYADVNYYVPKLTVRWKRQNIVGFSFNFYEDKYTDTIYRGEFAYYPNKPYNTFDVREKSSVVEKDTLSYMLGFDKEFFCSLLHPDDPNRTIFISGQMFQDVILASDDDLRFITYKTPIEKFTTRFTLKIMTGYFNDKIKPELIVAYDPAGNGMVLPKLKFCPPWSENYFVELSYVNYWGHQYEWLGFFKEKDSLFLRLRYMW